MSTFSGLNTAYTALTAARRGLDVVGQNIANATTEGYTRQRVTTSSVGAVAQVGPLSAPLQVGQGVSVDGIARLGNIFLDARVRDSAATSGYWAVRANTMSSLEASLQEPGKNGLSAQMQQFWAGWQDLANRPGESAPAGILLEKAGVLTSQIASGYQSVDTQWTQLRSELTGMAIELNDAASQVADLNGQIRAAKASGSSVNELFDHRNLLTTTIAALSGATVRHLDDGTAEVLIAGNTIVSGDTFRPIAVLGSAQLAGAATDPVRLEWAHRPGSPVALDAGEIAGAISMLAPTAGGAGGALAEAADQYNQFATYLATTVNSVHSTGYTSGGVTGLDFFAIDGSVPPALGLSIVPTDVDGLATAAAGGGPLDGSNADAIAALGTGDNSPDTQWSSFVTRTGMTARSNMQQAVLGELAASAAVSNQLSNAAVDMDEENINMLTHQVAYQGAARVITAIDEMLDTLINRTGIVGR
ncbi:MAG TPA: flagellar hook-associated protein FlgK [Homoserinimonas sp.]|nr:flagellar hook-associated protein FlgK [Homoserinimonas sp.]